MAHRRNERSAYEATTEHQSLSQQICLSYQTVDASEVGGRGFYFWRVNMTKRNLFLIATCLTVGLSIGARSHAQVNCNSQQPGSIEYTNCSNGLSVPSQQIGDLEYFNLNDGTNGTGQSIGDIDYYNSNKSSTQWISATIRRHWVFEGGLWSLWDASTYWRY